MVLYERNLAGFETRTFVSFKENYHRLRGYQRVHNFDLQVLYLHLEVTLILKFVAESFLEFVVVLIEAMAHHRTRNAANLFGTEGFGAVDLQVGYEDSSGAAATPVKLAGTLRQNAAAENRRGCDALYEIDSH